MKRTPIKPKRATPRRRSAPRWSWDEWQDANVRLEVRCGNLCERCGKQPPTERHHRQRRRDGGDRLSNILALCTDCHRHVTEHPKEARIAGYIVSVNRDPAEIPVLWRAREWYTLWDSGTMELSFLPPDHDAHA